MLHCHWKPAALAIPPVCTVVDHMNLLIDLDRLRAIETAAKALCADTPGRQEWKDLRAALAKEEA